ncbi:MAG: hypothetical protein ABFD75_12300 [Smithella sp.]
MYQGKMAYEQFDSEMSSILKELKSVVSKAHDLHAKFYDLAYNKTMTEVANMDQFSSTFPTVEGDEGANLAKRVALMTDFQNASNAVEEFKTLWETRYSYLVKFI